MPRGNPSVWKFNGQSYAQLSKSPPVSASCSQQPDYRAGVPSVNPPSGAGSFAYQTTWSLGVPGTKEDRCSGITEARTHYLPPPEGTQRTKLVQNSRGSFPTPIYPHDRKTLNQVDFPKEAVTGVPRVHLIKQKASENVILQDVTPQYGTSYKETFSAVAPQAAKAGRRAGRPAAENPGYNIISGGSSLSNNAFERFETVHDYRRTR